MAEAIKISALYSITAMCVNDVLSVFTSTGVVAIGSSLSCCQLDRLVSFCWLLFVDSQFRTLEKRKKVRSRKLLASKMSTFIGASINKESAKGYITLVF